MNKNTKIIWFTVIAILIISGTYLFNNQSKRPESLTLGLMLPLSGDYAAAGKNMQKGMELALDQYKKDHPESSVKIVIEDDGFDVKKGVAAYKKLTSLDKVDTILMLSTPVIDAIHEEVVHTNMPVIQLGVQTVGVADDNILQFSPSAEAPIGYLAKYLNGDESFNSKKVAVLYENSPGQIVFYKVFEENYKHKFTPFVVNSKNDLRGYATKIANENYDAVVSMVSPENGALLVREILLLDKTVPLFAFDAQLQTGFADYGRILGDTNKINGAKSMWFKEGDTVEFKKLYKEKYAEEPGFLADFAYDMINVALATYDTDKSKWVNNLQEFSDTNGVSGSISFDEKGVRVQPMVITEVRNGQIVPVE